MKNHEPISRFPRSLTLSLASAASLLSLSGAAIAHEIKHPIIRKETAIRKDVYHRDCSDVQSGYEALVSTETLSYRSDRCRLVQALEMIQRGGAGRGYWVGAYDRPSMVQDTYRRYFYDRCSKEFTRYEDYVRAPRESHARFALINPEPGPASFQGLPMTEEEALAEMTQTKIRCETATIEADGE